MKRAGLNRLERALPDIRRRVSALNETARIQRYETFREDLCELGEKLSNLCDQLDMIENQEELPMGVICGNDHKDKGRM